MNSFRVTKVIIVFSSLSYLSVSFLRNYNSQENIEKRCISKYKKEMEKGPRLFEAYKYDKILYKQWYYGRQKYLLSECLK